MKPVNIYENEATREPLGKTYYDYHAAGVHDERTLAENEAAFCRSE